MDLIRRTRGWALGRPHVLLVLAPGERQGRWAVEAELDRRGWPQALSPADADLLLVIGRPRPQLSDAVEVLWSQLPWPRHRVSWGGGIPLPEALDRAAQALVELAERGPCHDVQRPDPQALLSAGTHGMDDGEHGGMDDGEHGGMDDGEHGGMDDGEHQGHGGMDHSEPGGMDHSEPGGMDDGEPGDMDHSGMDHSGPGGMDHGGPGGMDDGEPGDMDHSGMDHSGPGGMDHGGHGGMDVAGLPMAGTAPDRDGLELDQLKVSLGPVLPGWPTGLVLQAALQGDVLTGIQLRWLDEEESPAHLDGEGERSPRVALDVLAGFLLVAGWPRAARAARQARDRMGSADPKEVVAARRDAVRLARRVARSRALAWNLRGLGGQAGTDGRKADLRDRVRYWCAVAAGEAAGGLSTPALSDLAAALEGAELGAARLMVASLGLSSVTRRPVEAAGV